MLKPENLEVELELTYLAKYIPEGIENTIPTRLRDVYVPEDIARPFVRLRQKGQNFEITKKKPVNDSDHSIQTEQTIPLDEAEFSALATSSKREVEKDRYQIDIAGNLAEVDIFTGVFAGLVVIDFEFASKEQMDSFKQPDCCLADVTQELFIAGGQLAGRTYADIEVDLNRFGYTPLVK